MQVLWILCKIPKETSESLYNFKIENYTKIMYNIVKKQKLNNERLKENETDYSIFNDTYCAVGGIVGCMYRFIRSYLPLLFLEIHFGDSNGCMAYFARC